MTYEDRELVLKDLGGRLPYGVKILDIAANVVGKLFLISTTDTVKYVQYETVDDSGEQSLYCIKPYLFPLSSMTYEQEREYNFLRDLVPTDEDFELVDNWRSIDYLNANHFDYRGLIENGLAIDATGLGIY